MKSKPDLWSAFEALSGGAVMAEWSRALAGDLDGARPFLRPSARLATSYPCTNRFPCGCRHRLERDRRGNWVSVCDCGQCDTVRLKDADVVGYEANVPKLAEALLQVLGWDLEIVSGKGPNTWVIGSVGEQRCPVMLWLGNGEAELQAVATRLIAGRVGPFVMLAPTRTCLSLDIDGLLKTQGALAVALSDLVALDASGVMTVTGSPDVVLQEIEARSAPRETGEFLRGIGRKIDSVTAEFQELRRAKQQLEKMRAEGLFKFTERIDADSFRVFCAILAHGDVAKASRTLDEKDSTIRTRVASWKSRGPAYKLLVELVRWRKAIGRREPTQLSEDVLGGRAASTDYPGLISDVLDELLSVDDTNWEEKCATLTELLRPYAAR
jgi:hypothetical protein